MERKTRFVANGYYHIYNRGADRKRIFISDDNYRFLLDKIRKYVPKYHVTLIAYCLMPNHYHFLLRQNTNMSIANFVQVLFNSYSKAFNKMYNRSGTLFEGSFKSSQVLNQNYLIHLCRYIHRNPIDGEKPLVKDIRDWPFSNYLEWIGERSGSLYDKKFVMEEFKASDYYREFVLEYEPPQEIKESLKRYVFD